MENKDVMLTAEEEKALLQPIDDHIGKIQEKINALRADGTDQIIALNNHIAVNTTIRSTITKSPSPARRRWPLKRRAIRLKLIS